MLYRSHLQTSFCQSHSGNGYKMYCRDIGIISLTLSQSHLLSASWISSQPSQFKWLNSHDCLVKNPGFADGEIICLVAQSRSIISFLMEMISILKNKHHRQSITSHTSFSLFLWYSLSAFTTLVPPTEKMVRSVSYTWPLSRLHSPPSRLCLHLHSHFKPKVLLWKRFCQLSSGASWPLLNPFGNPLSILSIVYR